MPNSNLVGNAKLEAEKNELRLFIKGRIAEAEAKQNKPRSQTIMMSGMSPASFYKSWNDPLLFRVGQLIRIYDYLKIPESERRYT